MPQSTRLGSNSSRSFQSTIFDCRRLVFRLSHSPLVVLAALWICLVYWNERLVFTRSVSQCNWHRWESWPTHSSPHHLALIADPQLVDPHTYPGRPWPLSTLTIRYTDLYLRRTHRLIQQQLYPDTTIFLGDLFDGGREWATGQSSSPEKRYKKYGESFWHKEYQRFSAIFYDTWRKAGVISKTGGHIRRRIMTNIPGNHDLGFAMGIQEPVRKRFNAYFGEGNALWLIANHTIVALDTVSLSAKEDDSASETIWKPTQQFLDDYDSLLQRVSVRQSPAAAAKHIQSLMPHMVLQDTRLSTALPKVEHKTPLTLPTILLSHVPLWRDEGTPCGPLREKWPQSRDANGHLLDKDERNAIAISRGYQYQNVISPTISAEITSKLKNIALAFSGDDHDYCDVTHHGYSSAGAGIREITVKSMSWAMGVRKPGIQLVSLWNPLAGEHSESEKSAQTQLCLLPDQLALFMHYVVMLGFTLLVLVLRALYLTRETASLLPISTNSSMLPSARSITVQAQSQGQSSSSDDGAEILMTKRNRLGAPPSSHIERRSPSPKPSHGYGLPTTTLIQQVEARKWDIESRHNASSRLHTLGPKTISLFKRELAISILKLLACVLPWYFWLLGSD